MDEAPVKNSENLFSSITTQAPDLPQQIDAGFSATNSLSSDFGTGISQNEKDAILRQIHPIFLTTHHDDKPQVVALGNFDKFLNFLRLSLEGFLKLVDIVIDAIIQIARLFVWIIAITGVLIVVTLMTNTTDKFIDLLNESVFKAFGLETRIAKVPTAEVSTEEDTSLQNSAISTEEEANNTAAATAASARKARLEAARKAAAEAAALSAENN